MTTTSKFEEFWTKPLEWPRCPNHTFLAVAFNRIGRLKFGEEWTGAEALQIAPHIAEPGAPYFDSLSSDHVRRLNAGYEARLANFQRAELVRLAIAERCVTGELLTAWRPLPGGAPVPIKPEFWITENLARRFGTCQMSALEPFNPDGPAKGWLFVENVSLERVLAGEPVTISEKECEQPAAPADDEEDDRSKLRPISAAELRRQITDYLQTFANVCPFPDRNHTVEYVRKACPNHFVAVKRVHAARSAALSDETKKGGRPVRAKPGA
jgi:hypothetical protein